MFPGPEYMIPADVPRRPMGYPDHGDEMRDYYELNNVKDTRRRRRSRNRKHSEGSSRSTSRSDSASSRSRSLSRSVRRSRSRSHTPSRSDVQLSKEIKYRQPSVLDAFRILYLTSNKQKSNTPKYLETRKKQDHVSECLKRDGLGSKKWLFYPRPQKCSNYFEPENNDTFVRENSDQRIKINGDFFRKFKKNRKVDSDSPIAKLKKWELNLYKKFRFIRAV